MTLILLDGMEDRSSFAQTAATISIVAGRHGNCLRGDVVSHCSYTLKTIEETDTLTIGFAVRFSALGTASFVELRSDNGGTLHVYLSIQTNGSVICSAGPGSKFTTATGLFTANTWAYVELQAKLHDTTGFVTMRVNGTQVGTATNTDTKNGGTKTVFDTLRFFGPTGNTDWDDVYVKGGAGETFMGDITVETLYPNGNGNANQWVGSDADSVNNYLLVNETGNPNTGTYTKSATVGQIDEYACTDLVGTGSIVAVCHHAHMALAAGGSQTFAFVNRRTTDTVGTTHTCTSTGYSGFHQCYQNDPETSAAWTIANVNALQSGVKVI